MAKSALTLTVKVLESKRKITTDIAKCIAAEMNKGFIKVSRIITKQIQDLVMATIKASPEYSSLVNGDDIGSLKAQFGLVNPIQKLDQIIDAWVQSIQVEFIKVKYRGTSLKGGISIRMIQNNWSDVLALPAATQVNRGPAGGNLRWLEWLLLNGDRIIVQNFEIQIPGPHNRSRTGLAVMVERVGKQWKVPPEFSGTAQNNFVTRSLAQLKFDDVISAQLKKAF